jgi:DNA-binding transcriptional LysR family regulator
MWPMKRKGEKRVVAVNGNFRVNNSETVRDTAVRGLGVGLVATFAIWQDMI